MSFYGCLQLLGGVILATGYLPQIAQLLRTRRADDINLMFSVQVVLGVSCMQLYALHLYNTTGEVFFLVTNTCSLVLSGIVAMLKIHYSKRSR